MATRTRIDHGITVDSTGGVLPVLSLPSFGGKTSEIAAKIVKDGAPIALVMQPRVRWNQSYGGWSGDEEYRFGWALRQIAAHLGGEVVLR